MNVLPSSMQSVVAVLTLAIHAFVAMGFVPLLQNPFVCFSIKPNQVKILHNKRLERVLGWIA